MSPCCLFKPLNKWSALPAENQNEKCKSYLNLQPVVSVSFVKCLRCCSGFILYVGFISKPREEDWNPIAKCYKTGSGWVSALPKLLSTNSMKIHSAVLDNAWWFLSTSTKSQFFCYDSSSSQTFRCLWKSTELTQLTQRSFLGGQRGTFSTFIISSWLLLNLTLCT